MNPLSIQSWDESVDRRLEALRAAGRWRDIRALDGAGPRFTLADGRQVVSFASNDYLGLSQHPSVKAAAHEAIDRWGTGSGASRLVVGDRPPHRELEAAIAEWKGTEAALLFPTGYAANLGVLTTFGAEGTLIVSDELNHASIVDGCRLSRASVVVARHVDVDAVRTAVGDHKGHSMIVTDTVFSMDGDVAPVAALAEIDNAMLIVDDAHAVLGPDAVGATLRVGTLSKTLGSLGGFVAGPQRHIDLLRNSARSFIFTTALPAADAAAASAALQVLRSDEGAALLGRLRAHIDRIRPGHPSPIIPVILGSEAAALAASTRLLDDHGLLVPAIRPPTVPPGTSRLRIALSAAHTDDDLAALEKALS